MPGPARRPGPSAARPCAPEPSAGPTSAGPRLSGRRRPVLDGEERSGPGLALPGAACGERATQGCAAWAVSSDKTSEPSLRELQEKINKIFLRNGENPLLKKKKNQLFL